MTTSTLTGRSGFAALNRRQLFKGGAAIAACALAAAAPVKVAAAPVEPLPLPLSYRGMFDDIIHICARHHGTTREAMLSPSRERREVRARQSAMFIARRVTGRSYPEIGRRIGERDHTTVLHADRKISALVKRDPFERQKIQTMFDAFHRLARLRIAAGTPYGRYPG